MALAGDSLRIRWSNDDADLAIVGGQALKHYIENLDAIIAAHATGLLDYKGGYNAATNTPDLDVSPSGVLKGDTYTVTAAGDFFSASDPLDVGDMLIAEVDNPAAIGDWTIVEHNLMQATETVPGYAEIATQAETDQGPLGPDTKIITPTKLGNYGFTLNNLQAITTTVLDTENDIPITVVQNDTTNNPNAVNVANTGNGNAVEVTNAGIGAGLFINQDGNGFALSIDTEATSADGISIVGTQTTGHIINATANNLATGGSILNLSSASTDATARNLVSIANTGIGSILAVPLFINQDIDSVSLNIDTDATTADGVTILTAGQTTGDVVHVTANALTSGSILNLSSSSSAVGVRSLASIANTDVTTTTATALTVQQLGEAPAVFIDYGTQTGHALVIDSEGTAGSAIRIPDAQQLGGSVIFVNADALTVGSILDLNSASPDISERELVRIVNTHVDADDTVLLHLSQAGADHAIAMNITEFVVGGDGKVGVGAVPLANQADVYLAKDGVLALAESATPTADATVGKVYTKDTNNLYFQDGSGLEHGLHLLNVSNVGAATYDLLANDYILDVTYTGTGAVTSLTLPTAQAVAGRVVIVKDTGGNATANNITIDTEGAETIDGAATNVINSNYGTVRLFSDGTNWFTW